MPPGIGRPQRDLSRLPTPCEGRGVGLGPGPGPNQASQGSGRPPTNHGSRPQTKEGARAPPKEGSRPTTSGGMNGLLIPEGAVLTLGQCEVSQPATKGGRPLHSRGGGRPLVDALMTKGDDGRGARGLEGGGGGLVGPGGGTFGGQGPGDGRLVTRSGGGGSRLVTRGTVSDSDVLMMGPDGIPIPMTLGGRPVTRNGAADGNPMMGPDGLLMSLGGRLVTRGGKGSRPVTRGEAGDGDVFMGPDGLLMNLGGRVVTRAGGGSRLVTRGEATDGEVLMGPNGMPMPQDFHFPEYWRAEKDNYNNMAVHVSLDEEALAAPKWVSALGQTSDGAVSSGAVGGLTMSLDRPVTRGGLSRPVTKGGSRPPTNQGPRPSTNQGSRPPMCKLNPSGNRASLRPLTDQEGRPKEGGVLMGLPPPSGVVPVIIGDERPMPGTISRPRTSFSGHSGGIRTGSRAGSQGKRISVRTSRMVVAGSAPHEAPLPLLSATG
jgi:hypothetical protein